MFVDILRILFFLAIAIPFIYMASDVAISILKGWYGFYERKAKPVFISAKATVFKF